MRITCEKVNIYNDNWKSEAPSIEFWENVSTPSIKTEQTHVNSETSNTKSEHMGETLSKIKLRRQDFRIIEYVEKNVAKDKKGGTKLNKIKIGA